MITLFIILALIATLLTAYDSVALWFHIKSTKAKGLLTVGFTTFGLLSCAVILAYSLFGEVIG